MSKRKPTEEKPILTNLVDTVMSAMSKTKKELSEVSKEVDEAKAEITASIKDAQVKLPKVFQDAVSQWGSDVRWWKDEIREDYEKFISGNIEAADKKLDDFLDKVSKRG
jgi:hypothetical protein